MRDFDPTASEFISSGYLQKSKPGRGASFYDPMSIVSAVAGPVIGGLFGNDSSPQQPQQQSYGAPMLGQGVSSYMGSQAAKQSAQIGADAADRATATQQAMYQQSRDDNAPYMQNGNVALSSLMGKMGNGQLGGQFTPSDYLANKDPGYDFQLQQGNQALQNSQAAHDGVLSGSSLKGLIDYNQGMASTGYQNAYQRWLQTQQNTFGQLSNVATMGANSANHTATTGATYGKGISDTITGAGNDRAAGVMGAANATGSGINSIAGMRSVGNALGGALGSGIRNINSGLTSNGLDQQTYLDENGNSTYDAYDYGRPTQNSSYQDSGNYQDWNLSQFG